MSDLTQGTYVLEIEWERPTPDNPKMPDLIGPFPTRDEAHEWAERNANGSWNVAPLAPPQQVEETG